MKNRSHSNEDPRQSHKIPDLNIIDLESTNDSDMQHEDDSRQTADLLEANPQGAARKRRLRVNIHIVLLVVAVVFVAAIIYKITTFGVRVNQDDIFADGPGEYNDTFDTILPLLDADSNPVYKNYGEGSVILAFGNAPFADDRDSEDNLLNMVQRETGATIYNCSVSGSYLASDQVEVNANANPWDIFNFYWLCRLAAGEPQIDGEYLWGLERLGNSAPPEAREVYDTLTSLDLNTVDVVVVMYDASDYLAGHKMFSDVQDNYTDVTCFTGNTEAGIEYLQFFYPNIRIIIMSPTYAYGLDEDGNYVSSDIQRYGQDVLSSYAILQYASCSSRSVTFVDNLYGTITEDNADKYLSDHLHLNVKGRKKVAERLIYALNYFNKEAETDGSD